MILCLQCYNAYGDIIKFTVGKAREINKTNCALTMLLSLFNSYKDIQKTTDSIHVSKSSQEFTDIKVRERYIYDFHNSIFYLLK